MNIEMNNQKDGNMKELKPGQVVYLSGKPIG